jgi:hypothetical protein
MKRLQLIAAACSLAAGWTPADPVTNLTGTAGTNVVATIGYLADDRATHLGTTGVPPRGGAGQGEFRFCVGGNIRAQLYGIVVVYPVDMKIPTEHGRKIELRGTEEREPFRAGEARYAGEVLHLQSWRYLDGGPSQQPSGGASTNRTEAVRVTPRK